MRPSMLIEKAVILVILTPNFGECYITNHATVRPYVTNCMTYMLHTMQHEVMSVSCDQL